MLSLISFGRGLWQKFQSGHPVIRWGGAILVALVVLEFVGDEAINLYIKLQTARATIARQNVEAVKAEVDTCTVMKQAYINSLPYNITSTADDKARVEERIDIVCRDAWGIELHRAMKPAAVGSDLPLLEEYEAKERARIRDRLRIDAPPDVSPEAQQRIDALKEKFKAGRSGF